MEEKIFKNDAKGIIDTLFDTKMFNSDVTRDEMNALEDLVAYMLSSRFAGYVKSKDLQDKYERLQNSASPSDEKIKVFQGNEVL